MWLSTKMKKHFMLDSSYLHRRQKSNGGAGCGGPIIGKYHLHFCVHFDFNEILIWYSLHVGANNFKKKSKNFHLQLYYLCLRTYLVF